MRKTAQLMGLLSAFGAALIVAATAGATTTVERIAFEGDQELCDSGNTVHIVGTLLVTESTTTTPSGGFMSAIHFQPQGVSGIDTTTGTVYRAVGLTRDIYVESPPGGVTETFVNRFLIQATRGAESYDSTATFHITISPDGTVRVAFDKFADTC